MLRAVISSVILRVTCLLTFEHPLPRRPLFGGLLLHLHQQPPHIGTLILQAVKDKVLNAGNTVPPRLKAEPFGDAVLTQVLFL